MSEIQSDSRLREGSESVGPDGEQSKKKLVESWHKRQRKSHRKSHKKIKEGRKRAKRRNKEQQR